jgi:uncharacterized membrane protein YbaN (DUF454 family)
MLGHLSVGLAVIGAILPLVPTTPFLLLAAVCYSRGSVRFHRWLFENKVFGTYLKNYSDGKGIPLYIKILVITFMWLSTLASVFFFIPFLWLKILVMIIPSALTIHILTIGSKKKSNQERP